MNTNGSSGWNEYSKYIIITLEKLGKAVEQANKDNVILRSEMVSKLTILKDEIYNKMEKCSKEKTDNFDKIIKELNSLITRLSTKIVVLEETDLDKVIDAALDKRFIVLNEKTIYPLKIKITMVCLAAGIVGGVVLNLIPVFFRYLAGV